MAYNKYKRNNNDTSNRSLTALDTIRYKRDKGIKLGESGELSPLDRIRIKRDRGIALNTEVESTDFNKDSLIETDRKNRQKAYEKAVELAKTRASSNSNVATTTVASNSNREVNAGDNRTTAINTSNREIPKVDLNTKVSNKQNELTNPLDKYTAGDNRTTAVNNNVNALGLKVNNENRTPTNKTSTFNFANYLDEKESKNAVTEKEGLANAAKVIEPYAKNEKLINILSNYVDLDDERTRIGLLNFQSLGVIDPKFEEYANQFKKETGVSNEEFNKILAAYSKIRHYEKRKTKLAEYENMSNFERTAKSIIKAPSNVLGSYRGFIGSIQPNKYSEFGRDYNTEFYRLANENEDIRQAQNEQIDKIQNPVVRTLAHYGYNASVMGIESATSALAGEPGLVSFLLGGYNSGLKDAEERGLKAENAQYYAWTMGSLEYLTEKIPWKGIREIFKGKGVNKKVLVGSIKPYIAAFLKQSGEEAGEEVINGIGDLMADAIISGDKSKLNLKINKYMDDGLSEAEATAKALWDETKSIYDNAVTAALSAGMSVGPVLISQAQSEKKAGREISTDTDYINDALTNKESPEYISESKEDYTSDEEYEQAQDTRKRLEEALAKTENNEKLKGKEARALYENVAQVEKNRLKNAAAKAEETAISDIKSTTTPLEVETVAEQFKGDNENINRAIEVKKAELISQGATESDFKEALTPNRVVEKAMKGEEISSEALKNLPEQTQIAYEFGKMMHDQTIGKDISKADVTDVWVDDAKQKRQQINKVKFNTKGELTFVTNTGKEINAYDANYSTKGEQLYKSENGILSLSEPSLIQIAIDAEAESDHSYPVASLTQAIKTFDTLGRTQGVDFETALSGKKYMESVVGREVLEQAFNAHRDTSTTFDEAKKTGAVKAGQGIVATRTEENAEKYDRQFDNEDITEFINIENKNRQSLSYKNLKAIKNDIEKAKGAFEDMSEAQKLFLEAFSKKTKVDFDFIYSEEGDTRGAYQPSKGKIILNLAHGKDIFEVALHEGIGEFLQAHNAKGYNAISTSILNYYAATQTDDLAENIRAYQAAYKNRKYRESFNEMANDAMGKIFSTDEGLTELINWLEINETTEQAKTVKKTFLDYFNAFKNMISDILKQGGLKNQHIKDLKISRQEAADYAKQLIEAMNEAIANRNAQVGQQGESVARNSIDISKYSYDYLVSQDNMEVNNIDDFDFNTTFDKKDRDKIVAAARENISKYNQGTNYGERFLINKYIGKTEIPNLALRHALRRAYKEKLADSVAYLPLYFENAIPINEADPRQFEKKSYVLLGAYIDGDTPVFTRIIVNVYGELEEIQNLYATNAKKEDGEAQASPAFELDPSSTISIKDFLEVVKNYFPNELSKNVADKLNINQTESEITNLRYSKKVDSRGNDLTEEQQKYFNTSKIRDKEGNLLVMYHGTPDADFTVFDSAFSDDNISLFFTSQKRIAESYAGSDEIINPYEKNKSSIKTFDDLKDYFKDSDYDIRNEDGKYQIYVAEDPSDVWLYLENETIEGLLEDLAYEEEAYEYAGGIYPVYLNITNPLEIDGKGNTWKDIGWITPEGIELNYTREISAYAKQNGYDGVIFSNIADNGAYYERHNTDTSDVVVAFDSNQIKSIYNPNPTVDPDIRYSIKVDNERVYTYRGIEIVQNPTQQEYNQMRNDIFDERPWLRGTGEPLFRHTYDEEGNVYYWDALKGLHSQIEPAINKHWNTRTSQQWNWWNDADKDFWPTKYNDTRYSKAVFGESSQYAQTLQQSEYVSKILSTLNNQLKGTTVSMRYIDDTVKYILDKYKANLNADEFKMELSEFIGYMTANENVDYNQMMNYLMNIGDEVIEASELKDPESERVYNELKKELASHKLNLTEVERKELIAKYGGDWKAVFGKLNAIGIKLDTKNGQHMDAGLFTEIAEQFRTIAGVYLDESTTPVDQVATIIDAMDALTPSNYGWEGANNMDKALDVAMTIIDRYYSMASSIKESNIVKGTEKGNAAVERAKQAEIKDLRAKQAEWKTKLNSEFQALVEDKKKMIQEQQEFYKRQAEIERKFKGEQVDFNKKVNMSSKEIEKTARLQAQIAYQGLKDTEAKRKHKDNIVRTCTRLINWMNKPTDARHVPSFLKPALSDMIKSINFMPASMRKGDDGTITAIKWQDSMRKLQQVIKSVNAEDMLSMDDTDKYNLALVLDAENIVDKMEQLLTKYSGTADLAKLSNEDLKSLSDIMTSISKGISQMNKNFMNRRFAHVSEAAIAAMDEMEQFKPISETMTNFKAGAADFLNLDMLEPISFFEELGDASSSIMQEFFDGEKVGINIIRESETFFDNLAKELNLKQSEIREWENNPQPFKIDGGTIYFTKADIMSLYCSYKREKLDQQERPFEATHHISAGGIKGYQESIKNGLKKRMYNRNARALHATEGKILEIMNTLSEKQMAYADAVVEYMSNQLAAHGNETSNQISGYSKYNGKYYFPLKTDNNAIATTESNNETGMAGMLRMVFPSFSKAQIDKADNALVVMNFFDVVTEHITGMANYCAYAMPLSDSLRWYNYAETSRNNTEVENEYLRETRSIKGSMDRVKGKNARKYFENFIRAVNLDPAQKGGSEFVQKAARVLTGLGRAKAIALNISVWVQQPTAIVRASNIIEGKYLRQGILKVLKNPKAACDYAQDSSYLCYWKNKGFSDYRVTMGMKEIITGQDTVLQSLQEKAGAPAGLLDDTTWAAIYYAVENKINDTTNFEIGSDEYNAAVEEMFSDIINHTQVIDSGLRTTQTMKSRSDFEYLANAFKKEPQKSYNMLHRAAYNLYQDNSTENKKAWNKAVKTFLLTGIVNGIVVAAIQAERDDDDEAFLIKWLRKLLPYDSAMEIKKALEKDDFTHKDVVPLLRAIWGGMGTIGDNWDIFSSIPLVAEVDSWLKGYSPSKLDYTSLISEADKTIKSISSANTTPYNMLYSIASLTDYVTGLGISNALKDFRGIWNQTTRVTGLPRIVKSSANEAKAKKDNQIEKLNSAFKKANNAKAAQERSDSLADINAAVDEMYNYKYDLYIKDKEKPKTEAEAQKQAKSQTKAAITSEFKPTYIKLVEEGNLSEANALRTNLIYAYRRLGYDMEKEDFDKWLSN